MTIQDLGSIGEFVGGLAVIATLIYLAVQIRQNSQLLRRAAEESVRAGSSTTIGLPAQSAENAAVFYKGLSDPGALSPEEGVHFSLLISNMFVVFQEAYEAHRDGLLPGDRWARQRRVLQVYASNAGVRAWWALVGRHVSGPDSDFAKLVESEMQGEPAATLGPGLAAERPVRQAENPS